MPQLSRPTVCLVFLALTLSALREWDRVRGEMESDRLFYLVARWSSPQLMRQEHELDARTAATMNRMQRANEVADAVAEGRMSLLDGAARLRDLSCGQPTFSWLHFRARYAGASDDERFCRMLIVRVRNVLPSDGERACAVAARLEAELQGDIEIGALPRPE